jgi:hypothetical protein
MVKLFSLFKRQAICLSLFLLVASISNGQTKDTLRVLFVGNSYIYYNNLIQMVSLLSDSTPTKLICTKSTVGGTNLGEHWDGRKGLYSKQLIEKNKYDIVVIQDNSMWPIEHADSLLWYGEKFCQLIKGRGARPFLYNTWSRKKTPQTQTQINEAYGTLSKKCGAIVVPVGQSFQELIKFKPEWELYHHDGSHPSTLGTFLAALSFVKAFTGTVPDKMPLVFNYYDKDGESFRIMQVTPEEVNVSRNVVKTISAQYQ